MSGRALLDALVLGVDVECRVGNAIYPDHYDRGWHITGSTGMLGAAAGCARLLRLDVARTTMALGIAASQPVGVREQFGSMTKSLHPGAAARAGLTAALMAKHGYTASERALEAPRGLLQTYSAKCDWREIHEGLGERFEIATNTYKPFACGIVIHPSIDGCIQLRDELRVSSDAIERVELVVHPLVLELTGKRMPRSGLEGKFSVYHACAAALLFGMAGEPQFSDACVADPSVVEVRDRVHARADTSIDEAAAEITLTLRDGRTRAQAYRARDRQPAAADERRGPAREISSPRRSDPRCRRCNHIGRPVRGAPAGQQCARVDCGSTARLIAAARSRSDVAHPHGAKLRRRCRPDARLTSTASTVMARRGRAR